MKKQMTMQEAFKLDFLEELQHAHDAAEDAEDVRSNLKAVAVAFGLEVPK